MSNLAYFPLADDWIEDLDVAAIWIFHEDPDYPEEKIQNIPMADTARAIIPSGGVFVRLNFGVNRIPRIWAFLNHNITSGNWIIRSYNDAFVTPSGEAQTVTYRALDTKHYYKGWTAKQYWEIDFGGCTYSDSFWEMGKIMAGSNITEFTKQFSPGIRRGLGFDNIHNETEFGVIWSYIKRARINYLGISWDPHLRVPLLTELEDFIETTYGGAYPAVIIPDNMGRADLYYMKNQDELRWNEELTRAIIAGCHLDFKELSRGQVQEA